MARSSLSRRPLPRAAKRRPAMAVTAMVVLAAASGCARPAVDHQGDVAYQAPAWMAQTAQDNERYTQSLARCLQDAGFTVTVTHDSYSFAEPDDLDATALDALREQQDKATYACMVATDEALGTPADIPPAEQYTRQLQIRECLVMHGYPDVTEPPSEQAWIQNWQSGSANWRPYEELLIAYPLTTEEQWYELKADCPESGYVYGADFAAP